MLRLASCFRRASRGCRFIAHRTLPHGSASPRSDRLATSTWGLEALLRHYLCSSFKPPELLRTGIELELIGFHAGSLRRLAYEDTCRLLKASVAEGGTLSLERGLVLRAEAAWGSLTLEPGNQLEFASRPSKSLLKVRDDVASYLAWLREYSRAHRLAFLAIGFDPITAGYGDFWYLKDRYKILREYLSGKGAGAWDMMCQTASIQVSLDYCDFEDFRMKFLVGSRISPIAAAMFANSPFRHQELAGCKTQRYATWLETDPERCGVSRLATRDAAEITCEELARYIGGLPMILTLDRGVCTPADGCMLWRRNTDRRAEPSVLLDDLRMTLSTIFTDCRIKNVVELRSADCGDAEHSLAAAAFWKGLLYSKDVLAEALKATPNLTQAGFLELQADVARRALQAEAGSVSVLRIAQHVLELAEAGLREIAPDETCLLDALKARVSRGVSPADLLIEKFETVWHREITALFQHLRVA